MIFNPKTRQFTHKGRALPTKEIRDQLETFIDEQKDEVDGQAKKVLSGTLTLGLFFSWLREKIKQWHSTSGVIAYGGQSQMNLERWKRINEKVQKELAFLDKWQREAEQGLRRTRELATQAASLVEKDSTVPSGLESVVHREVQAALTKANAAERGAAVKEAVNEALADSVSSDVAGTVAAQVSKEIVESNTEELLWGSLQSRGKMYADSLYATYENSVKARETDAGAVGVRRISLDDDASCEDCPALAVDEYVGLDEIADIGDSQCGANCRCEFEFSYLNIEPLGIDQEIYA